MALQPRSQPPKVLPSGVSFDPPYGPLADCGVPNPFFYHAFQDDFDFFPQIATLTGGYTVSAAGAGTVALAAGDGGRLLFTTAGAANNFESIQTAVGDFTLPLTGNNPPVTANSSKKIFYLARLQLSDVTLGTFIAGLCVITATPFTTGVRSVVDGLFFYKAPGAANTLQLINIASNGGSPSGTGFTNTFNIPTAAYTLTNNVDIDLSFSIDGNQNLYAYVGAQLVGWIPQSGFGSVNAAGVSILPAVGPALANYNYQSQGASAQSPIMYTTVNLSPTLAVSNGITAAVKTMNVDFHGAWKER